jgi:hypothetical protein
MEERQCEECGEDVGYERYWCLIKHNGKHIPETIYVCWDCMEKAVGTPKLIIWMLNH